MLRLNYLRLKKERSQWRQNMLQQLATTLSEAYKKRVIVAIMAYICGDIYTSDFHEAL